MTFNIHRRIFWLVKLMSYMWQLHIFQISPTIHIERWALQPVVLTYHRVNIYRVLHRRLCFLGCCCNITHVNACSVRIYSGNDYKFNNWMTCNKIHSEAFIICFNDSLACQEIKMDLVSCIYLLIVVVSRSGVLCYVNLWVCVFVRFMCTESYNYAVCC